LTQNATPKRTLQYKSRLIESDNMERAQTVLYKVSDMLRDGTCPASLAGLTKSKAIECTRNKIDHSGGYYSLIDTGKFADSSPLGVEVQELLNEPKTPEQEEREKARLIESKIMEFAGLKIPGFFVTHKETAQRVIEAANIQDGEKVLEPSAGTGNLAEKAREAGGLVKCVEIRPALAEILRLKGFDTICGDFLDPAEEGDFERFNKIVMNPPFEKGADADHVKIAYSLLKEGGRLVAIMSEGTFFRSDSKAVGFRDWLESVGGGSEKLPDGSFNNPGEVNRTGTAARIVVIDK